MADTPEEAASTEHSSSRDGESLFAYSGARLTDTGHAQETGAPSSLRYVRDLTAEETHFGLSAEALLDGLTQHSVYRRLRMDVDIFHEAIERLEQEAREGVRPPFLSDVRLEREFQVWLTSFKAFEDHTKVWLTERLGSRHTRAHVEFQRLLSFEFDHNFAYRVCCALRNASIHRGNVLNDLRYLAGTDPDGSDHRVYVWVDGPRLAETFPKMRAATREELRACSGPLEVEWLVGAATASCNVVFAGLFDALRPVVDWAISLANQFHDEAVEAGGDIAVFLPTRFGPHPSDEEVGWMRDNSKGYAGAAERLRETADGLCPGREQPRALTWEDFLANPA